MQHEVLLRRRGTPLRHDFGVFSTEHGSDPFGHDPMRRYYFVYIMASRYRGTLYIGVTRDLPRRVREHREKSTEGFTKKYAVTMLVYYETYEDPMTAIHREKLIKRWRRAWKFKLIEEQNKDWNDCYDNLLNELPFA